MSGDMDDLTDPDLRLRSELERSRDALARAVALLGEAMANARVLARSYRCDRRPPERIVERSESYPVNCTPAGIRAWLNQEAKR